jgi:hypothetical protein
VRRKSKKTKRWRLKKNKVPEESGDSTLNCGSVFVYCSPLFCTHTGSFCDQDGVIFPLLHSIAMARAVGFSLASDHLSRHSRSSICGVCNCGAGFDFLVFTSGVWLDIASLEGLRLGEEQAQAPMHIILYPYPFVAKVKREQTR